jgi:hypothetical protein
MNPFFISASQQCDARRVSDSFGSKGNAGPTIAGDGGKK